MGDDEAALLRLWREKRGEVEPEDLSGNLIVQLGLATEPLNRLWYERNTGNALTQIQSRVQHPVVRWMAATLDGMVEATGAVFEAKFMLPWSFTEEGAAEKHMARHRQSYHRSGACLRGMDCIGLAGVPHRRNCNAAPNGRGANLVDSPRTARTGLATQSCEFAARVVGK
jgi:YqaJ-like viral recombinase domain